MGAAAKLGAAQEYLSLGWRLLLLGEGTGRYAKRPHADALRVVRGTSSWSILRDQPLEPDEIRYALNRYPAANVGIICGDGLAVVDVEAGRNAPAGLVHLTHKTPTATTPSGGFHSFFRAPTGTKTRRMSWGDLQAGASYVAAPPAPDRHWLTSPSAALQPLPEELLACVTSDTPYTHSDMSGCVYHPQLDEEWVHNALHVLGIRHRGIKSVHCPLHPDGKASAGVLWGHDEWVLSCRACKETWGLPYLFALTRRGIKLNRPTVAMWATRLLHETGAVELPEVAVTIPEGSDFLKAVAQGFHLALRVTLHRRRDEDPLGIYLANSFGAPWCGVCQKTFVLRKGELIRSGWLRKVGPTADGRGTLWLPAEFEL